MMIKAVRRNFSFFSYKATQKIEIGTHPKWQNLLKILQSRDIFPLPHRSSIPFRLTLVRRQVSADWLSQYVGGNGRWATLIDAYCRIAANCSPCSCHWFLRHQIGKKRDWRQDSKTHSHLLTELHLILEKTSCTAVDHKPPTVAVLLVTLEQDLKKPYLFSDGTLFNPGMCKERILTFNFCWSEIKTDR